MIECIHFSCPLRPRLGGSPLVPRSTGAEQPKDLDPDGKTLLAEGRARLARVLKQGCKANSPSPSAVD